jgi:hypothetical protein
VAAQAIEERAHARQHALTGARFVDLAVQMLKIRLAQTHKPSVVDLDPMAAGVLSKDPAVSPTGQRHSLDMV